MKNHALRLQSVAVVLCIVASVVAASWETKGATATPAAQILVRDLAMPNLVRPGDIGAVPAGSPQRSVLEWVHAIQVRDTRGVLALTAPATVTHFGPAEIRRAVRALGRAFAWPQINDTIVHGRSARVELLFVSYVPGSLYPVLTIPKTMRLVRVSGRWLISSAALLFPLRFPGPMGAAP